MADYDAIVIGGGHHGTIIAAYLAKAGMKVGVFERQDRLGGGAVTEIGPAPGFRMSFCAHWTRFYAHPAFRDFNLYDEGLHHVIPETGAGIVFDDGTSLVGYPAWVLVDPKTGRREYSEENVKKTYEQIAFFSKTDAETYLGLTEKFRTKWASAASLERFSLPTPWGVPSPLEKLFADPESGLETWMQFMTVRQHAHYLFESPELRILFCRGALTTLTSSLDDVPGLDGLIAVLGVVLSWSPPSIAVGGNGAITDALVSAGRKLGAEYFINSDVGKIIVENGVAKGVRLANGGVVQARQLVVADTGIPQLLFRLLGDEYVTQKIRRRVDSIIHDRGAIIEGAVALNEPPQYKAAESNPDVNRLFRLYWCPRDLRYFEDKYWHEIRMMGFPSQLAVLATTDSLWDHSRAPEGKHITTFEEISAPVRYLSYRDWRRLREGFILEHLVPQWQRYAPNITDENVIASRVNTPVEVAETHLDMIQGCLTLGDNILSQGERFRGIPELPNFRTPIKNLYMCSSAAPGGQGIGRSSSYRCYRVIAGDFGLTRFWEREGF